MRWRLDAAPRVGIKGRFWQMLAPCWAHEPLSGAGAARAGGRWNEPGQPALYLSDSHATAIAEYQQDLPRPGTLTAFDVEAFRIIDLGDPVVQQALGIEVDFLRQPWKQMRDIARARPPSWDSPRRPCRPVGMGFACHRFNHPGPALCYGIGTRRKPLKSNV